MCQPLVVYFGHFALYYSCSHCDTTITALFQAMCLKQNATPKIVTLVFFFCNIFPQNFCYRLAVLPGKEKFPHAAGTEKAKQGVLGPESQLIRISKCTDRFKLSVPFGLWG